MVDTVNFSAVGREIQRKMMPNPYFAHENTVEHVMTDMDRFPYNRFFRGVYYEDHPVIFDREAGYRPVHNACYTHQMRGIITRPHHCFESACSVVYPCIPEYLRKYSDKEELDLMLNRLCIDTAP